MDGGLRLKLTEQDASKTMSDHNVLTVWVFFDKLFYSQGEGVGLVEHAGVFEVVDLVALGDQFIFEFCHGMMTAAEAMDEEDLFLLA